MDKKQIKNKLIEECEVALAEHEARILIHEKSYNALVGNEQDLIDIIKIKLEAYKKQ